MPQPNPIKQSSVPGIAIGDYSEKAPLEPPAGSLLIATSTLPTTGEVPTWDGEEWAAEPSGGGPPTGPAGGVLSGTYPNPGLSASPEAIPNGWTATTQAALDDSTKLATTAYTDTAVAVETARAEAAEALLAPKASPTFTGTPAAPTATPGTNTTQLATTAFVEAAVGSGGLPPGGSIGQFVTNTGSGTGDWEWPFPNFIRVSDHGAKGDCRFGSDCTTAANNTTVAITDTTLTSPDATKEIVINGACNATGGGSWATTISSVTDSTHCVVASAPTKTVTNLSWAIGTDDTPAYNNSITAGQALNAKRWTMLLDDVAYMIAGSLVTTNNYNTQIALPYISSTANRTTIEIRGKSLRPTPYFATATTNWPNLPEGPILFSSLTNQSNGTPYSSSVGVPSMIGGQASAGPAGIGGFTQVALVVRGVTFLGPHWPYGTMLDAGCCQQAVIQDCLFATNEGDSQASPGWRTNAACIMPLGNNNDHCQLLGMNTSINHVIGFVLAEHSTAEKLLVYQAYAGVAFPIFQNQNAPTFIGQYHSLTNVYPIAGWDPGNGASYGVNTGCQAFLSIGAFHTEEITSGIWQTNSTVYCANNFYMDAPALRSVQGTGAVTGGFSSPGRPRLKDLGQGQGPSNPPSIPSSGSAFPKVWRDTLYVFTGGSGVSFTVGGVSVAQTSGPVLVPSGYSLVCTYSGAPTIQSYTPL